MSPELPPEIATGDALSYFRCAEWMRVHWPSELDRIEWHVEEGTRLAPNDWHAWAWRAFLALPDHREEVRCLDAALSHGAILSVRVWRMRARLLLGQIAEAEHDAMVVLQAAEANQGAMRLCDPDDGCCPIVGHEVLQELVPYTVGRLRWIKGDLQGAFEALGSRLIPSWHAPTAVWAHLCQLAHGVRAPLHSHLLSPTPPRCHGVWIAGDLWEPPRENQIPPQPSVRVWELLVALFGGQLTDADLMLAARSNLAEARRVTGPENTVSQMFHDLAPSRSTVRPAQVHFYRAMWLLQAGKESAARTALEQAMHDDHSDDLERLAAAGQLRRLAQRPGPISRSPAPLAVPPEPPSLNVEAFVTRGENPLRER